MKALTWSIFLRCLPLVSTLRHAIPSTLPYRPLDAHAFVILTVNHILSTVRGVPSKPLGFAILFPSAVGAAALSVTAEPESHGWGTLAAAAAGASLAGLAAVATTDAALRAPHVEVTNVHVGWGFGTLEETRAGAKVRRHLVERKLTAASGWKGCS
jgi:hypothetical protein